MAAKKKEEVTGKRVGVWLRVSTEEQARGESPEHHEHRARHYAEAKGWSVVEVYHLEAVSGKAVMDHPEAKRMMKDVERGHITGLIFSKLARLARNTNELLKFAEYFQSVGADLISLQESIDTSTPAGRFFYTVMAALAHWEREEIASRVAASIPVRAKMGKSLGGPAPFGYQWKDKKLIPEPNEAPVRRLVHELFLKHKRHMTVARLLNEAGHRTRKGKPFSQNAIKFMVRDSTPKGLHRANYVTYDPKKRDWVLKPESEWVFRQVEPILTTELWDACYVIAQENSTRRGPRSKRAVQLFAGLLFCSCGQKMYVRSNTPKYVCGKCRNKIPITDMDEIFIEQLGNYMLSPEELTQYLEVKDQDLQAKIELLGSVVQEEKNLRAEMEKVYRLYMSDQITPEGFGSRYKPMEARLQQIQEELPKLEAVVDFLKVNLTSRDAILSEARDLVDFWPSMSHEAKRKVVETVVERIILGKDEIQIDLFYLPTPHSKKSGHPPDDDSGGSEPGNSGEETGKPPPSTSRESIANRFSEDMVNGRTAVQGWVHSPSLSSSRAEGPAPLTPHPTAPTGSTHSPAPWHKSPAPHPPIESSP